MKITAILCNYNGEAYLDECIQSVLAQDRPVDEFIIVDDGSTDGSREIIREYTKLPNVCYIPHEVNQGQAAGFNTAIEAATGDLLCFIDSDDLWFPAKIGEFEKLAEQDLESVLFQHNLSIIRGGIQTAELFRSFMASGDLWSQWEHKIFFPDFTPTTGLAVRAEIAKSVLPVPTNLRHSADSYLTRSVISLGPVSTIMQPLGGYRYHGSNAVLGNDGHDSWRFFKDEVAPHLHKYYLAQGLPSPVLKYIKGKTLIDKLLNLSIRSLYYFIRHKFTSQNS